VQQVTSTRLVRSASPKRSIFPTLPWAGYALPEGAQVHPTHRAPRRSFVRDVRLQTLHCYVAPGKRSTVNRILRQKDVKAATGLSRTTIWRLIRHGAFPAPRRLTNGAPGKGAVGWLAREVEAWLASRPTTASELPPANGCETCASLLEVLPLDPSVERWMEEINDDLASIAMTHGQQRR